MAVRLEVADAETMVELGRRLAGLLRAGDLLVLTGDLGAGKTTLTRGIGEGLEVRGAVTSPTFVIARVHPAPPGRPDLVHVDAYRLSSLDEVDDLDLDVSLPESVTVVEWGEGKVEGLAPAHLRVLITRRRGFSDDASEAGEDRTVVLEPSGDRWSDVDWTSALGHGGETA